MDWDSHIRLRHIRTFLEIARAESVSAAAAQLNITQPAVSRSLKELEEMLGTPLFDRVGRGLRLNEAGRVFQAHASASVVELMRGRDRVAKGKDMSTRLSIGVLPTAATDLVPRAALVFREEMPFVRLHILTGPNWLLFNQLREGTLDLVVGRMPERDTATGTVFEQLYSEDVILVARPGHPALVGAFSEKRFLEFPLILPPKGAVIFDAVERYFSSIGLPEMRGAIETVALPVGRKFVALSDALWFISKGVVGDELELGTLAQVELSSSILTGPVGIGLKRDGPLNSASRAFIDCLRGVADLPVPAVSN